MSEDKNHQALTYAPQGKGPDVGELQSSYQETVNQLDYYLQQCRTSYDDRRNYWPGKSTDHRKHGSDAMPWDGASDQEAHVISEKLGAIVSNMLYALRRSHIRAFPVSSDDAGRARLVSSFLKYMRDSWIPGFRRQMELGANYLGEKFLAVYYVGWERQERTRAQEMNLEEIAAQNPGLAEVLADPQSEELVIEALQGSFPKLSTKRARSVLRDLRKNGRATLPVSVPAVDRPIVETLAPDVDVFFPSWTMDPQQAPYIHVRKLLTSQQLLSKVASEGWDRKWAEHIIDHYRGVGTQHIDSYHSTYSTSPVGRYQQKESDLIEVVWTYQRLVDPDDGSEGIYCTVWHPEYSLVTEPTGNGKVAWAALRAKDASARSGAYSDFAKHELLEGWDDYPIVVSKLSSDSKRLYDGQSICDLLRGIQWQVKVERDQRIDGASLRTVPPYTAPRPLDWRPKGYIHLKKSEQGSVEFLDGPKPNPASMEIEGTLLAQADRLLGLDPDDPDALAKKSFFVDRFLDGVRDVLAMAYKAYQIYGPDEVFFRVSGAPEGFRLQKDPEEQFDISVNWDSAQSDPESVEKKLGAMVQLIQFDRNGKLDVDTLLEMLAASIDPSIADSVLRSTEQAQDDVVRETIDDWTRIFAGVEVPARPSGAATRLKVLETISQQPDVQASIQGNEALQERIKKHVEQYQFQLTQANNAVIGQIGTEPAAFQQTQL